MFSVTLLVIYFILRDQPMYYDPYYILQDLKISNANIIICAQLNINSMRNKYDQLKSMITGNIDILIITETKLNYTFPQSQFFIEGYSKPYRLDCTENGGGVMIYVREDIPTKSLDVSPMINDMESLFIEINFRNRKWLLCGAYIPHKHLVPSHLEKISYTLDLYLAKYDNLLIMGDFNTEVTEPAMKDFCGTYQFKNLVNSPTCYKNPVNPSRIDLILTNKPNSFLNTQVVETGLSDFHKMTITITRSHFPKMKPNFVTYRNYKNYDVNHFRYDLNISLSTAKTSLSYENFEDTYLSVLDRHAPCKTKIIRANEAPFMAKELKNDTLEIM